MSRPARTPLGDLSSRRLPILGAALCLAGLAGTWVLAELVPATHVRDAVALADLTRLNHPVLEAPASALLLMLEPPLYGLWSALILVGALRRRHLTLACALVVLLVLAPLSAELLKPLLAHPHAHAGDVYITAASWPSGHATAATTLVWAALLAAPPARRRTVALVGTVFAAVVGWSLLMLAWHMPSDVLGGYLLATLWGLATLSVLQASGRAPWAPGSHSDSVPSFAARLRMNSISESRLR